MVSNFNDLQSEGIDGKMHSGAPASNVEVMLRGAEVERVETGGDPVGQVRQTRVSTLRSSSRDVLTCVTCFAGRDFRCSQEVRLFLRISTSILGTISENHTRG